MLVPIVLALLIAHAPITAQSGASQQPPASPEQSIPEKPWPPSGVVRAGSGVAMPRVIKEAKPSYTAAAVRARVEGRINLEAVVHPDGTVGEVRVVRSLDKKYGLDEQAVTAVKQWRFAPVRTADVAVPVLVEVELTFSLRNGGAAEK